ncbi:MAG: FAD-dependent oxidoreductase [Alphaproteobacteria bacterium]|nr:FAD-dependent oxidoreductase [Alphaproteobacteria bacterium]
MLRGTTALAGAYAAPSLLSGFRQAEAAYQTTRPNLPATFGKGKTVAIVGAGVAGLTTAHALANAGFKVAVFEADNRYGWRSLTARPENKKYQDWWFDKYDDTKLFPKMYADRYRERGDSPAPAPQICRFMDDPWKASGYEGEPVELFLNAGPGRIPSNHVNLISLCQDIGVGLEPYFFQSMSNLMQSPEYNGGAPVSFAQITYSLYGEMAEMMAKINMEACKLQGAAGDHAKQLSNLYQLFGDLKRNNPSDPCDLILNQISERLGFSDLPGGWRDKGKTRPTVGMEKILKSKFIGDASENPEFFPGSYLFNNFNVDWQPTLMQPIGGMDRIWQQLLLQDVPGTSAVFPHAIHGRETKVGDLVFLDTVVIRISAEPGRVILQLDGGNEFYQW